MEVEAWPAIKASWALSLRLGKAGHAVELPQVGEARAPRGEQLVDIALMPHVEDHPVARSVIFKLERDGQLHRPEVRGEVAAGLRKIVKQKLPDVRAERGNLRRGQAFKSAGHETLSKTGYWDTILPPKGPAPPSGCAVCAYMNNLTYPFE